MTYLELRLIIETVCVTTVVVCAVWWLLDRWLNGR